MEGCESCVIPRCNSLHWVLKGMCGHFHAQRRGQYIFLKSPARIRHVIHAGVSFSRDCLSCDLKWCFSTSSHVPVLGSWLSAANRCIVLQVTGDPPHLSRAWYVFGKVVPCSRIYLYLIILNHDWLHFHENVRRHVRRSRVFDHIRVELILKHIFSLVLWQLSIVRICILCDSISNAFAKIIIKHAHV